VKVVDDKGAVTFRRSNQHTTAF